MATRCDLPLAIEVSLDRFSSICAIQMSSFSDSRPRHVAFEVNRMIVGTLEFPREDTICGPTRNQNCLSDSLVTVNTSLIVPVLGSSVKIWVLHSDGGCNRKDVNDVRITDIQVFGNSADPTSEIANSQEFLPQIAMVSGDVVFHAVFEETRSANLASALQVAFVTIMPHVQLEMISVIDVPLSADDLTHRAFHYEIMVIGATDLAHFTASLLQESQSAGKIEEVLLLMNIHVDGYTMTEVIITFDVPLEALGQSPSASPVPSLPSDSGITFRAALNLQGIAHDPQDVEPLYRRLRAALRSGLYINESIVIQMGLLSSMESSVVVQFDILFPSESSAPESQNYVNSLFGLHHNEGFLSVVRVQFPGITGVRVLSAEAFRVQPSIDNYLPHPSPSPGVVVSDGGDAVSPDGPYIPDDSVTVILPPLRRLRHRVVISVLPILFPLFVLLACCARRRRCQRAKGQTEAIVSLRSRVATAQVVQVPCVIEPVTGDGRAVLLQPVKQV